MSTSQKPDIIEGLAMQGSIATANDIKILGCVFGVTISKEHYLKSKVREHLETAGLDPDDLYDGGDISAYRRSMEIFREETPEISYKVQKLKPEDGDEEDSARYQNYSMNKTGEMLDFKLAPPISFDKKTKEVLCDHEKTKELVKEQMEEEKKNCNEVDIRQLVTKILKSKAQAIKPRSGVYFVPNANMQWVDKLVIFLELIKIEEYIFYQIADLGDVKSQLKKNVDKEFMLAIRELKCEFAELEKQKNDNDSPDPSPRIMTSRLKKISELQKKVALYNDTLKAHSTKADDELKLMNKKYLELLV